MKDVTTSRIRFGICTDQNLPWPKLAELWRLYEELGFDSVWDCDHLIQPTQPEGDYYEAWTLLAGLAAVTSRIRVGVLVSSNTFRHPSLLVKEAITVDHISQGRLELGIGAGWYEPEHTAFGLEFPPTKERIDRFEEAVQIIDAMLGQEITTFIGRYYQVRAAPTRPRPLQRPRPPLTIGAKKPRMLGIAARWADCWNASGTAAEVAERNRILDEKCAELGRDPKSLRRSVYFWVPRSSDDPWSSVDAFVDVVGRYREAGIEEFVIDQPREGQLGMLERVAADVIPRLRAG
jgi:F420-dependent oxidoreductase-like protein